MERGDLLAELGHRVRERRTERGLTLRELATRAGLSPRFVADVEAGRGNPSVASLAAMAEGLETSAAALLSTPAAAAAGGPRLLALLGLRGAGKSSVGRRAARQLRLPFVELDRRIEEACGLTLDEVFALHGEPYYRRLEREALEAVLREKRPLVLATGGGLVAAADTFARLRERAVTVWLRARPEDHWNRVVQQGDRRPMADHPEAMAELRRLLAAREPLYALADAVVDTSRLGLEAATRAVVQAFSRKGARGGAEAV